MRYRAKATTYTLIWIGLGVQNTKGEKQTNWTLGAHACHTFSLHRTLDVCFLNNIFSHFLVSGSYTWLISLLTVFLQHWLISNLKMQMLEPTGFDHIQAKKQKQRNSLPKLWNFSATAIFIHSLPFSDPCQECVTANVFCWFVSFARSCCSSVGLGHSLPQRTQCLIFSLRSIFSALGRRFPGNCMQCLSMLLNIQFKLICETSHPFPSFVSLQTALKAVHLM